MSVPVARTATPLIVLALTWALVGCSSGSPQLGPATAAATRASAPTPAPEAGTDQGAAGAATDAERDATLDAYVAAAQGQVPALRESLEGYSDFQITGVHPSTLAYEYVYEKAVDPRAAADYLDGMVATLQGVVDAQVLPEMERAGITDPHVRYTYDNPDGSTIWSHVFAAQ